MNFINLINFTYFNILKICHSFGVNTIIFLSYEYFSAFFSLFGVVRVPDTPC